LTIRLPETRDDREKVYEFRYIVYVQEIGRWQVHAGQSKSKKWMQTGEALPP